MKLFGKVLASVALLGLVCISPLANGSFGVQASAATTEAALQTTAQPATGAPDDSNDLLGWGVFLYAAGEVATSIALGIAHVRKTKRQEALQEKRNPKPTRETSLLQYTNYYKEHREALAGNG